MPAIFYREMNRRNFIHLTFSTIGAAMTVTAGQKGVTAENSKQTHIAFLSDTHISGDINNNYRGFFPYQNLDKVIPEIQQTTPNSVVIAGDLARLSGEPGDYQNLKKLLSPIINNSPVYMALGNHDNRDNFSTTFQLHAGEKQTIKNKHVLVVNQSPVRLIILDSLMFVNKTPGYLGSDQRAWLEQFLNNSDNLPTILVLHHSLGDGDNDLLDTERLFRIVEPVNRVKAIINGHSHKLDFTEYKGLHLISLPATGYNFNDDQPVGWIDAEMTATGADLTLKAIAGNTTQNGKTFSLAWR